MATKFTFSEAKNKFGFTAKRTNDYWVVDETGRIINQKVKVMSMGGGLYVIDEIGNDITSRVRLEKKITEEQAKEVAAYERSHGNPDAIAFYDEDVEEWCVLQSRTIL